MLCDILATEYQVLPAENGEVALSVLKEYGEGISLILLDIVMPVMDGYTFLSIVKADSAYSSIPIIVTTQGDSEADEVEALSKGAADFVVKPYKPRILLHRVANFINLRETAAMVNLVQYDQLTGLYGKEFFCQKAKEILLQHPDRRFDIFCSDVENFKLVNDIFGLPTGNRILCCIADFYRELVGDQGICCRLSADQFACLLEHREDYTDEMFRQMEEKINASFPERSLMIKWGVYEINDRELSVDKICDWALLAARGIKGQYGKYFAVYDDTLRNRLLREQEITDSMETALAEEQFEVYLQPKYDIKSNTFGGAEALIRWRHPEWGMQSPGEFIPLFEKNGFITKLDQFVWEKACEVLHKWDVQGIHFASISVNVSRADIYNADLAETLIKLVRRYDLSPERLHLEITESAYTEDPKQIIDVVEKLRELGFIIEMDDFGSGYSSLNMLGQMPIDILKLDMKFIRSETAKLANQGILRFIMSLARWMHLRVVAEGVETKEQLERLKEIGCDYVQGYYFARPMPWREFEELIRNAREEEEPGGEAVDPSWEEENLPCLLVADEDEEYRSEVVRTFAGKYRVIGVSDCGAVQDCVIRFRDRIAALIISLTLPAQGGENAQALLYREKMNWDFPVIVTGFKEEEQEAAAFELGADDFAGKPHRQSSLLRRVLRAVGSSQSRKRMEILEDKAGRDCLTGLLNRWGFVKALELLDKGDEPLAAFLFDLDGLKKVNNRLGRLQGNKFIQEFAEILKYQTRKSDILARFSDDDFVVIMKHMTSREDALKKAEVICQALEEGPFAKIMPVTCTGGIAVSGTVDTVLEMVMQADLALRQAKDRGEGGCCLWEGETGENRAEDMLRIQHILYGADLEKEEGKNAEI